MKAAAIILALFAVLFEGIAAAEAGLGAGGAHDAAWLVPGGIACLALAFVFTLIPA